jgi:23S rRNA pseudouridine2605 synthase
MEKENVLRLSKKVAACTGLSRREASDTIKKGNILVDGKVEKDPSFILTGKEEVKMGENLLTERIEPEYYAFNKAKSMNFEKVNDKKRPSVKDIMAKTSKAELTSLYPLPDFMCGLLILTNDPALIDKFSTGIPVIKQVFELECTFESKSFPEKKCVTALQKIKDLRFKKSHFEMNDSGCVITLEMYGHSPEKVSEIFYKNKIDVRKTDRIYFGGITKKDISRGWFRKLTNQEIILLKHFFNPSKKQKND